MGDQEDRNKEKKRLPGLMPKEHHSGDGPDRSEECQPQQCGFAYPPCGMLCLPFVKSKGPKGDYVDRSIERNDNAK